MGARAQRGAGSSGSRAALPMGKAFPTKSSRPRLLPARGAGTGGDISGGGLGDKVSGSIPESLRPPAASPSGSKLGILGADPGCHSLQSQVSPEVPSLIPSRGCLGILWNRGCAHLQRRRKFGNSGLLPALPESHPGLGFPAGNPLAPGDIGTSLSTSPSLPSVSIRSPGFSRSNFPDLQDHPFSIFSSCLPCNPCNSHGSVPPSSRFPAHSVLSPRRNPALPAIPQSPTFPLFSLLGNSRPFISGVWDVKGLKHFPGSRWRMEFLMMAAALPHCPSSPRFFMELL